MKKNLLTLFLINSILIFAQEKIVVQYESITDIDQEFMEQQIAATGDPESRDVAIAYRNMQAKPKYFLLELTNDESEFNYVETINNDQSNESNAMINLGGPGTVYKNLKKNILAEAVNYPKDYILQDTISNLEWKISGESKEILGYETRKAEAVKDSTTTVVAWYSPKLAFKNGPAVYGGLPGLILQLEETIDNKMQKQTQVYTALSLKVGNSKKAIKSPKKGKIISRKEYDMIIEEEVKRMKEMFGGGVETE